MKNINILRSVYEINKDDKLATVFISGGFKELVQTIRQKQYKAKKNGDTLKHIAVSMGIDKGYILTYTLPSGCSLSTSKEYQNQNKLKEHNRMVRLANANF